MSEQRKSEFEMIEQPERGGLKDGLHFGYVDVPEKITCEQRAFLNELTANSLVLQKEIRTERIDVKTADIVIPTSYGEIKARVYMPGGDVRLPLVMNYHGGGFAIRDIECFDYLSRKYAKDAPAVVVTIDYDLAPEKRFPTQAEEAYEALLFAREHAAEYGADPERDVVTGDSAGGNLSTVVSQMCRDRGLRVPKRQILAYPVVDARPEVVRESDGLYGVGYNLDYKHLLSYNRAYIAKAEDALNPYVSPLLAKSMVGLPACRMISAQCDILLDSGMEYAKRLKDAGVDVDYRIYKGMPHDFLFYGFPESYDAYRQICAWIREV